MVQNFVPASQLELGTLVFISDTLAHYVGRPELARTCSPVTAIDPGSDTSMGVTLAAIGRSVGVSPWGRLEVLPVEEQRPLAELQCMTADDLTCHALAHLATNGASPYSALVVGLLAMELDEDEPDVSDRIQAAADQLVSL